MEFLKDVQTHGHTRSCKREIRGETVCRFKMPKPPMKKTMILYPLDDKLSKNQIEIHQNNFTKIMQLLNTLYSNRSDTRMEYSFEDFLSEVELNCSDYILAIRSSLKNETIFYKRKVKDILTNVFNLDIIELHKANMDIQFILNPYSLCNYLVNYIQKSMSGISKILQQAMDEVKSGNYTIRQKLLKLSSKFVNGVEVSAQEVAYSLLGLHMSEASVATIFINTFPLNDRTKMLKSKKELSSLPPDSRDIFVSNYLDHYQVRPLSLEICCLAEFVAPYEYRRTLTDLKLIDGSGYLHKRKKMKVIRYQRYDQDVDPENFERENVMLFYPYRNEENDILRKDTKEIYNKHFNIIANNRMKFNKFANELEELNDAAMQNDINDSNELDAEFKVYGIQELDHDLSLDFPELMNEPVNNIRKETVLLDESEYKTLIRSLNEKQREYLAHVLDNIENETLFYDFVSGKLYIE